MLTIDTITDEQIQKLRDQSAISAPAVAALCVIALRSGVALDHHPPCFVCNWRKGGVDSWDGKTCKCGLRAEPLRSCDRCGGIGKVPYDIGSQFCPSCDGSGLFEQRETTAARARCVQIINEQAAAT